MMKLKKKSIKKKLKSIELPYQICSPDHEFKITL